MARKQFKSTEKISVSDEETSPPPQTPANPKPPDNSLFQVVNAGPFTPPEEPAHDDGSPMITSPSLTVEQGFATAQQSPDGGGAEEQLQRELHQVHQDEVHDDEPQQGIFDEDQDSDMGQALVTPRKVSLKDLSKRERKALRHGVRLEVQDKARADIILPRGGEPRTQNYKGEILIVGELIQLLHPWARFVVSGDESYNLNLEQPPAPPPRPTTKREIIKVFVGLSDDSTLNRIYRATNRHRVMAGRPCYLRINDKKGIKTKEGPPSYGFIDQLGAVISEDRIWFSSRFTAKAQRDQAAQDAADQHRALKEIAWREYLQAAHIFWVDRVIWEWKLVSLAWGRQGITFPTDRSKEEEDPHHHHHRSSHHVIHCALDSR